MVLHYVLNVIKKNMLPKCKHCGKECEKWKRTRKDGNACLSCIIKINRNKNRLNKTPKI